MAQWRLTSSRYRRPPGTSGSARRPCTKQGRLPARRAGNKWLVRRVDFDDYIERCRIELGTLGHLYLPLKGVGPEVPVPDDAPLQHRLLGLIGRDPGWT
jgi:hypothetical protein